MNKTAREKLRQLALAAYRLEWESYDANEGLFPPRPLWCVANDAYHNPNQYIEDGISFAAQIECGCKEDADYLVAAQPKQMLALLDHIDALEGLVEAAILPEKEYNIFNCLDRYNDYASGWNGYRERIMRIMGAALTKAEEKVG